MEHFLDLLDVVVRFVGYEGRHDVCLVLVLLLVLDLFFEFLKFLIVLHLNSISPLFQQVDHLLAIEDEVDPRDVDSLHPQFLLKVFLEKDSSWKAIRLVQLLRIHQLELLAVPRSHVNFDVVVRRREIELIVRLPEPLRVVLVDHEEDKGEEGGQHLDHGYDGRASLLLSQRSAALRALVLDVESALDVQAYGLPVVLGIVLQVLAYVVNRALLLPNAGFLEVVRELLGPEELIAVLRRVLSGASLLVLELRGDSEIGHRCNGAGRALELHALLCDGVHKAL